MSPASRKRPRPPVPPPEESEAAVEAAESPGELDSPMEALTDDAEHAGSKIREEHEPAPAAAPRRRRVTERHELPPPPEAVAAAAAEALPRVAEELPELAELADEVDPAAFLAGGWKYAQRMGATPVRRMDGPFEVDTPHGTVRCADGWLGLDDEGNPYPIGAEVFGRSYVVTADGPTRPDVLDHVHAKVRRA